MARTFARAVALLAIALSSSSPRATATSSTTNIAVKPPTQVQLAYASKFADVGAGTVSPSIGHAHYAKSRDLSRAAVALHKGAAFAEKDFTAAASGFVEATTASNQYAHAAVHGVRGKDETSRANTLRPVNEKAVEAQAKAADGIAKADSAYTKAIAKTYHSSLLEVASSASAKVGVSGAASGCEVCVYVVENKQMHQPFLCRGLKDPAYQQTVCFRY